MSEEMQYCTLNPEQSQNNVFSLAVHTCTELGLLTNFIIGNQWKNIHVCGGGMPHLGVKLE